MPIKYQAKIFVTLRPSVLDPAGVAVQSGLKQMEYNNVENVRIWKNIEMMNTYDTEKSARKDIDKISYQMLENQ